MLAHLLAQLRDLGRALVVVLRPAGQSGLVFQDTAADLYQAAPLDVGLRQDLQMGSVQDVHIVVFVTQLQADALAHLVGDLALQLCPAEGVAGDDQVNAIPFRIAG